MYFPEFPEIRWMARCSLPEAKFSQFLESLDRRLNRAHCRNAFPASAVGTRLSFSGTSEEGGGQHDFKAGGYVVELPADLGSIDAAELGDPSGDSKRLTHIIAGDFIIVRIEKGRLKVGDECFGLGDKCFGDVAQAITFVLSIGTMSSLTGCRVLSSMLVHRPLTTHEAKNRIAR